jgi:hypothetical protein
MKACRLYAGMSADESVRGFEFIGDEAFDICD